MTVNGERILVTGAAGMIGSALARELVKQGATVTIADNLSRGSLDNIKDILKDVRFMKLDLTECKNAEMAVKNQDRVVMLAARLGGIKEILDVPADVAHQNMLIDINTIRAAKNAGVRHVTFASSACSYGPSCDVPAREDDPKMGLDFDSIYGRSKFYSEHLIRAYGEQYGIRSTILRFFNVHSEHEPLSLASHVIPCLCHKAMVLKQDPFEVWGSGGQTRSFLHTDDVVRGILLAMEKAPDGTPINLGTPEKIKIRDLAHKILEYSGHTPKEVIFDTKMPEGVHDRCANNDRARELLGWQPTMTFDEGLRKTVEGFKRKVDRDGQGVTASEG
ncbi:SDR family NAD(P)-dependent oxidoreductase [Patescibacteria group bacterium]|nr:SDR family NAD(P)-dependent oxidoreductase [Patescibacteria group bacterium]